MTGILTIPQIWSMKKNEDAAAKKKPKTSAAQIRVQKGMIAPILPNASVYVRYTLQT